MKNKQTKKQNKIKQITAGFNLANPLPSIHLNRANICRGSGPQLHPNLEWEEEEKGIDKTYSQRNRIYNVKKKN